jgi:dCMP deaminase
MAYHGDVPGKDEYFLNLVNIVKTRSKDLSQKVGCVIVSHNDSVLSMGYNGFPRGVDDEVEKRYERPLKYSWTEHAERNAIYNAARNGVALEGATIYLKVWPCVDCARGIIQAGIDRVIMDGRRYDEFVAAWTERWEDSITTAMEMMLEAGVRCYIWKLDEETNPYLEKMEDNDSWKAG